VSGAEHGKTRGLVAAAGLEADETVLNDVDTADTVLAGNGVGSEEELDGLGDALAVLVVELDGETLLEVDGEVLRGIGCLGGIDGQLPHVLGRSDVGVLEDAGLVAAVCHVLVHAPWLALGAGDRDALLGGVVEKIVAALEAVVEHGVPPGCDDLDAGLESVEGQLEADLVVTLASATVGDGEAALLLGDSDLGTSDDGAGEGGTEEVGVLQAVSAVMIHEYHSTDATDLVDSVASNGWEAELLNKLLPDVLDVALAGTDLQGLLLGSLEVLLLTNIGHEANDLVALILDKVSDPQTNPFGWIERLTRR
jgi:hypothetical protein